MLALPSSNPNGLGSAKAVLVEVKAKTNDAITDDFSFCFPLLGIYSVLSFKSEFLICEKLSTACYLQSCYLPTGK